MQGLFGEHPKALNAPRTASHPVFACMQEQEWFFIPQFIRKGPACAGPSTGHRSHEPVFKATLSTWLWCADKHGMQQLPWMIKCAPLHHVLLGLT